MVGGFKQLPRIRPPHDPISLPVHPSMYVDGIFSEPLDELDPDETPVEEVPADPDIFPEPLDFDYDALDEFAATVATAADDEFDEDGRLIMKEPLKQLPRPEPTILYPQPTTPRDRPTVRFAPGDIARISKARGIDPDDETTWR
jgi:hypothetical protein